MYKKSIGNGSDAGVLFVVCNFRSKGKSGR